MVDMPKDPLSYYSAYSNMFKEQNMEDKEEINYEEAALNLKGQEWIDFINSLTEEQKIKLSQCWD